MAMPSISEIWERTPTGVRWAILLPLGAAVFVVCLTLAWALWGSGYIHQKFGIPITTEHLDQQTEVLQADQGELIRFTVDTAISAYDARLWKRIEAQAEEAQRNIVDPILMGMEALKRNDEIMMRSQARASDKIDEMPKVFHAKLDRLINRTKAEEERERQIEMYEELLRRAREGEPEDPEPTKKSRIRL